jgi:hypothetical protein
LPTQGLIKDFAQFLLLFLEILLWSQPLPTQG